jgi:hypothetical protein
MHVTALRCPCRHSAVMIDKDLVWPMIDLAQMCGMCSMMPGSGYQAHVRTCASHMQVDAKHAMPRADTMGMRAPPPMPDTSLRIQVSRKLFVGGLPSNVTDTMLRQHFEQARLRTPTSHRSLVVVLWQPPSCLCIPTARPVYQGAFFHSRFLRAVGDGGGRRGHDGPSQQALARLWLCHLCR